MLYRATLAAILVAASAPVQSGEIEQWACIESGVRTVWTIAENRMFVAKGKGSLQVVSNSPSVTVAYNLKNLKMERVVSYVYILDKSARKLIVYDDVTAAIFVGKHGQQFEPRISVSECEPSQSSN